MPRPATVLAFVLVFVILNLVTTSRGQAVGLLQLLFAPPPPVQTYEQVPIAETPKFTSPQARHAAVKAKKHPHVAAAEKTRASGGRALCVRMNDGFFFPPPNGGNVSAQQAGCERMCPDLETRLFFMPSGSDKLEDAKDARSGATYGKISTGFTLPTLDRNAHGCQPRATETATLAGPVNSLYHDPTLRRGDIVVLNKSIRIFRGTHTMPYQEDDFVRLSNASDLPKERLWQLAQMERQMRVARW